VKETLFIARHPPPHVASVNMISVKSDPWFIPSPDLVDTWGEVISLSPTKINYMEIVSTLPSISSDHPISRTSLDVYSQSPWLGSLDSPDPLAEHFIFDKSIMEVISLEELPWNDTHHRSSFFSSLMIMSTCLEKFSSPLPIDFLVSLDIVKIFPLRAPLSLHRY